MIDMCILLIAVYHWYVYIIYMSILLTRHKYVRETDIVGDKEGGMRVKRRAVNTLDAAGGLPNMIPYILLGGSFWYDSIYGIIYLCFFRFKIGRNILRRYVVNTLDAARGLPRYPSGDQN